MRKIHREISLKPGMELRSLPTYSIPERWEKDISKCINEKNEHGISEKTIVDGAAPIFAQEKKAQVRMGPLVDLTASKKITFKNYENIPNQTMILNSLGRV